MRKDRIKILYEDKSIIVVSKPTHLLTIATQNEKERTMFHKVIEYERKKNKNNKVFIVHRLDKDTSGIIVFAKSEKIKKILQDNWDKTKRYYMAIVEGIPSEREKTIKSYLAENSRLITYSTSDTKGKLAITKYKLIKHSKKFSLLDIEILTGRKNQIRVHMMDNNTPIVGDKKYGSITNPMNRLGLHAYKIIFSHPITNKEMIIEDKLPKEFEMADFFNK
ncbi:MAG: RNA pseudouridine synthase [Bacilli bacterium]|nr:RNA pseudouridine synthase [Bacilli bacterium]